LLRGELLVSVSRRLRAPQEHGAVVAEPPLADVPNLLTANRQELVRIDANILGQPWAELRRQAQDTAVAAARSYLREAGEPVPSFSAASLVMAGHQPELFHPGVWVKNFALHQIAQENEATPINLVVDNDTAKSTSLRIPVLKTQDTPWPHVASVPFDHWSGEVPYEERSVQDEEIFAALPTQVAPLVENWGFVPILPDYWGEARRQAQRTPLLGERLAAARRTFERRWGCHNFELPVSLLCRTEPFAWFACHLLAHLPRFHAVYNACVRDYRRQYGIRSRNHPVPELATEGDWLEAPLWAWRAGAQHRGRLLARQTTTALELRVGQEAWPSLPLPGKDGRPLVSAWQELAKRGFKVRSRALTNTLYARLFLADLFMHGIGGGKYDELTDEIVRRFYGCEPPSYLVLSATLLLPLPSFPTRPEACRRLAGNLRDVHYNPQRHLVNGAPRAQELTAQKDGWIARQPSTARERRDRFTTLRALTEQLRTFVADQESALQQALAQCERELQGNAVLENREYAFCLYPGTLLKPFFTGFLTDRA
jgi:hypothetical protein